ncbi:hypothetical protein J4G48_0004890 [Bradyrhizobium barranii subsp. apii]|uniref:hypothetical protein n=1 Tax=Bradyrhizobium barranii TaxID=2992140 RepID=UPI001CD502E8|nr:hypothetical protein [Bradyrhizobium barranii]UPT97476.1 hypothetical protein J4G48_0004890 [Bradyrhizobium barranii subsp. apii]
MQVGRLQTFNLGNCQSFSKRSYICRWTKNDQTDLHVESPQLRQVQRADIPPATGYATVVDGHFKSEFVDEDATMKAAAELLAKYPMLKIEIHDASSKSRLLAK